MKGLAIGRIVHFHPPTTAGVVADNAQPAIITKVHNDEGMVNLAAFGDMEPRKGWSSVPYSKEPRGYSWHWPEKE